MLPINRSPSLVQGRCKLWWLKSGKSPNSKSPYKWKINTRMGENVKNQCLVGHVW
jgi:hypothetical protein